MNRWIVGLMSLALVAGSGCAITLSKRSPWDIKRLAELSDELERLRGSAMLQEGEAEQLQRAKGQLQSGVGSSEVSVGYDERGLVTRFLDQVLFDSGKAQLRHTALPVLDRVAQVLQEMPNQPVGIEGHTDNVPIKHSGWPDNTALSVARANAVADYLVTQRHVNRDRLTVIGYGEEQPLTDNGAAAGRQKNRRVELVILPQSLEGSYRDEAERVREEGHGNTRYTK